MRLPHGIRRLFRLGSVRSEVRRDVDDELDFHFAEAVRRLTAAGLSEVDALAEARARFGDERAYRHTLERIDTGRVRMRERSEVLDSIVRTVGYALRGVRRAPGFTASVVLILALGIGANAVMFGVVDRLLLSPPQHIVDADDVRLIYVRRSYQNGEIQVEGTITYPDYRDFDAVDAFAQIGAFMEPFDLTVGRGDRAARARVAGASASLLRLLGVEPVLGRFFSAEDDFAGAEPTAVLAQEYWEREYGADPAVLGRSIEVGAGSYVVIGVAPAGFTGATLHPVDIWLPLVVMESTESGTGWEDNRGWYWLHVVARLSPDATVEAAQAEATAAHRAGRAAMIAQDRYDRDAEVLVAPIIAARGPRQTQEAQVARWLGGVSLIVLLIACFNVANLLLTRSLRARREVAVRLALGVGRSRLIGEAITESVVLAALGAAAALLLARAFGTAVHQVLLPDVAFTDVGLAGRLVGFTLLITVVAALLSGIVPALQAGRADLADALKAGGRGATGGRSRARVALLVGQAALSVVLLVGAGLFVRSLRTAQGLDLGFDASNIAVVSLEWNESLEAATRSEIYGRALEGIRRLPGVHAAGLSYTVPFRSSIGIGRPRVPGLDSVPRHRAGGPYANKVGSGYFEAMGLTIVQGRAFEPRDDDHSAPPVTILSEGMARAIWPDGGALGACMLIGGDEENPPCTEVVGIVENHRRQELVEDDPHFLYYLNQPHPAFQGPPQALMVGTSADADDILATIRQEAAGTSPQIRFVSAVALRRYVEPQLRSWYLGASTFTAFGLLALIVAGWGLYSVLAFDVALRRHELGIRSALGAGVSRLVRLVARRAIGLVGAGVALGLLVAWAGGRWVEPLLFRVPATDPRVYALVAVTLLAVGALAGSLPAWRATRVDPRETLQAD